MLGEDGVVGSCPGRRQCSGHGVCDDGYGMMPRSAARARKAGGGDCSGRLCPAGLSWFSYPTEDSLAHNTYASCSNMGCCDEEASPGQYESPLYNGRTCSLVVVYGVDWFLPPPKLLDQYRSRRAADNGGHCYFRRTGEPARILCLFIWGQRIATPPSHNHTNGAV